MIEGPERELFRRGVRDATARVSGRELDEALKDLGWHDALALDEPTAVSVLFESQGVSHATSSALADLLTLGGALERGAGTMLLPVLGSADPPARLDAGRCVVRGLVLGGPPIGPEVVAVTVAPEGQYARSLPLELLDVRPVGGLDPELGLCSVEGAVADPVGPVIPVDWDEAVALGRRAVAHELVGAAHSMLDLARRHALERIQFGRPIAAFQAVRHRLAESLVAVEAAEALLSAAWEERSTTNAALAKSFAGRQARVVGRHCQQVLAGIGFTAEHPFHRYLRRVLVLDALLGSGAGLTRRLGTALLETGRPPRPFPL